MLSVSLNAAGIVPSGKQLFSTSQRYRQYLEPERIEQIMLEERLNEICASINVQILGFMTAEMKSVCGTRQSQELMAKS